MSSTLNLNCLVLSDDASHVFPVEIANSRTVGDLRDAITLQEFSTGKNTRKKFSSCIYLRASQFKARKKFSSLM